MISRSDLVTAVQYQGAKIGDNFKLIGFVDVKHDDTLVFHANLTERSVEEVAGLSQDLIQALAQDEANSILESEQANKAIDDYITLKNLGLY